MAGEAMTYRESAEQIAFIEWCRWKGYPYNLIYSVENEGVKTPQAGARAKAMGKRAGVPDLFLPVARGEYHGLYIEMKSANGRVSDSQKRFIEQVQREGYAAAVCFSAEEAVEAVQKYTKG